MKPKTIAFDSLMYQIWLIFVVMHIQDPIQIACTLVYQVNWLAWYRESVCASNLFEH